MHPRGSGGHSWDPPPPPKWPEGVVICNEAYGFNKGEKMQKMPWNKRHSREFLDKYPTEQDFLDAFPQTLMKRIREIRSKDFIKGFVTASLIIILLHVGLAYYLVLN